MISIARIFEAWRNAEQFERPTEDRSFLWHLFKFPQFGLLIFSLFIYFTLMYFFVTPIYWISVLLALAILIIDIFIAWAIFEHYLKKFREKMRDGQLVTVLDFARRMALACNNLKSSHVYFVAQQAYEDDGGEISFEEFEKQWNNIISCSTFMLEDMGIEVKPITQ